MTATELIVVAVAVFAGAFVLVLAGFGFALLAMPIMTLAIPVQQAVVVSTLLGMISTTWLAWHLRADTVRPLAQRMIIAAFFGMPLGLFALNVVPDETLRLILGVAVLIATGLLAARLNFTHVGPSLDFGVGFLSGVLNTSLSTNGPPLVFGLQSRHLEAPAFRATITTVFAFSNIGGLTLFAIDGKLTLDGARAAAVAVPAWVIGQVVAWPIRRHIHGERFRVLVLGLLFLAGASTIVFALT